MIIHFCFFKYFIKKAAILYAFFFIGYLFSNDLSEPPFEYPPRRSFSNDLFIPGEILRYKIYVLGINVGEQSNQIVGYDYVDGAPALHIYSRTWSYSLISHIYVLDDVFEVWLDTNTLRPLKATRDIQEGGWTVKTETVFNWRDGKVVTYFENKDEYRVKELEDQSVELLSLIYIIRAFDFSLLPSWNVRVLDIIKMRYETHPVITEKKGRGRFDYCRGGRKNRMRIDTYKIEEEGGRKLEIDIAASLYNVPVSIIVPSIDLGSWGTIRVYGRLEEVCYP